MADPRGSLAYPYCPRVQAASTASTADQRSFFNAVGRLGDIQALNDFGKTSSNIGQGLRTLTSISNSIRTGCGSLPSVIGSTVESGANWVLQTTGIAPDTVQAVQAFNPGIANQAYTQAKNIFNDVKTGRYNSVTSIPGAFQDLQNLERLGRGIYTPTQTQPLGSTTYCGATPYAVDLINRAPKSKFLFVVSFTYNDLNGNNFSKLSKADFSFVVKNSSRPKFKIEQEDVNFYNYRTKVITKASFEEMRMNFHDDSKNASFDFYKTYMQLTAPITNFLPQQADVSWEERGMDWSNAIYGSNGGINTTAADYSSSSFIPDGSINRQSGTNIEYSPNQGVLDGINSYQYSASRGPLTGDVKTIFKEITLYHVFHDPQGSSPEKKWLVNIYHFLNPRVSMIELDDVDMAVGNEGTSMSLSFNYDSVYLETETMKTINDRLLASSQGQAGGTYQGLYGLQYTAPGTQSTNNILSDAAAQRQDAQVATITNCGPNPINTTNPPAG